MSHLFAVLRKIQTFSDVAIPPLALNCNRSKCGGARETKARVQQTQNLRKKGNRNDKAEPIDTPLDTKSLDERPATAKPTGLFLRRELPDLGTSRAKGSSKQGIRGTSGEIANETNNIEQIQKRSIEMKKFWSLSNRGFNDQNIQRRSEMKKLIALGIAFGLAVAAMAGVTTTSSILNAAEPTGEVSVVISERTARDLVDFLNGEYVSSVSDLRSNE